MQQVDCPHCERVSQNETGNEFCSQCGVHLYKGANIVEDKRSCGLLQSDNISTEEEPLVVLRPKRNLHYMASILVCGLTLIILFCVIVPVVTTGDYSSVFGGEDKWIGRKIVMFYIGLGWCSYLPFWPPYFKKGLCCFYSDRLEVHPFIGQKKITFMYGETQATCHGNYRLCIHPYPLPPNSSFAQRYKIKTLKSVTFPLMPLPMILWRNPNGLENPKCIDLNQ